MFSKSEKVGVWKNSGVITTLTNRGHSNSCDDKSGSEDRSHSLHQCNQPVEHVEETLPSLMTAGDRKLCQCDQAEDGPILDSRSMSKLQDFLKTTYI